MIGAVEIDLIDAAAVLTARRCRPRSNNSTFVGFQQFELDICEEHLDKLNLFWGLRLRELGQLLLNCFFVCHSV